MDAPETASTEAVLLAAGESTRMGQPKALLPWTEEQPLLTYQVRQLLAASIERVAVVLGHRSDELRALLPLDERVEVVDNLDYGSGKVSSILAGVRAVPSGRHILILGVDQPRSAALVRRVAAEHLRGEALITIGGYLGRRGHPVIFAPQLRGELLELDEATKGLRAVLARHAEQVHVVETGSPLALANLNTPEDYDAARLLLD